MRRRLSELDIPERLSPHLPVWVTQILFAAICTALAFSARALMDMVLPSAGPFALTFPSVLLATLFARWQAGVLTQIFCCLYAWYFVLPIAGSFAFEDSSDGPRVIVNALSGFVIVALAETFRQTVRRAVAEREAEVDRQILYLKEFDHRVKNSFAIISSMLSLQQRDTVDEAAAQALSEAQMRVTSIARAHGALYRGNGQPQQVEMRQYLNELADAMRSGLMENRDITLDCVAEPHLLDRDQAISVGLIVNELVTNAVKHAFPAENGGHIDLHFSGGEDHYRLEIGDNGKGMTGQPADPNSLGQRLMTAFVQQAHGSIEQLDGNPGTRFVVTLEKA